MAKLTRYLQNIGINGITKETQEKLFCAKVIVMGAGALGSGVIMNLAALGIGQIKIIDDKVVDEEDLNSQLIHKYKNIGRAKVISAKDWISDFNPDIKVEIEKTRLNELNYFNVIENYDIIVDCFNGIETKYMLNEIALRHNKILIHGYTQGFIGQATTVIPGKSACLSCIKQKPAMLEIETYPSIASVNSVISSILSQEVLKVLMGGCELLTNKLLLFDGYKTGFKIFECTKNIACPACKDIKEYGKIQI